MIFKQLFDTKSSTYTYIISSGIGREALLIDPVIENTQDYLDILNNLKLKLVKVIDTHIHADHISGLKELQTQTNCLTIMGEKSLSEIVTLKVKDGEKIKIENIELTSIYTPGHTDDSYSFLMNDRVFTGDTLLINGTGRTDFQKGDPRAQYDSLFNKLLKLPEDTLVYPAHDYKGNTVSTIAEEKKFNPRLQVSSAQEYALIMNNLNLDNPKLMDIAVPINKNLEFSKDKQKTLNGISYEGLENLSKSIPHDWYIYVKDHPGMLMDRIRPKNFYSDIKKYPNVRFLNTYIESNKIILNSKAVLSTSGTTAFDAILLGKPVIETRKNVWSNLKLSKICTDVENLYDDICEAKEKISIISREDRDQLIKHYFDLVLKYGFKQENVKEAFYNRINIVDEHKKSGYSTGDGFLKYLNY